ncbi:hypothetical protein [Haloferula sp. BvORR071]|uniref:hypothetical protein n=1 Tax=Haloferula sp. BvORR071 TaxID=1396141 RepID=UPI000A44B66B|nr:hypothetical protein [Haloferula sp. BvORR071]
MKLLLVLLGLASTHAAAFLLAARAAVGPAGEVAGGRAGEWRVPAKSVARGTSTAEAGRGFARLLDELEHSGLDAEAFQTARLELFQEWIRKDLGGAMDRLLGPLDGKRYKTCADNREIKKALTIAMAEQSRTVWDWIAARRFGTESVGVAKDWLRAMRWSGQSELLEELLPGMPGFCQADAVAALLAEGKPEEMARLRGLVDRYRDVPPAPTMVQDPFGGVAVARGVDTRDRYAARMVQLLMDRNGQPAEFYTQETDPVVLQTFTKYWTQEEIAPLAPAEAVQALLALPEEARGAACRQLLDVAERPYIGEVAELLEAMAGQGMLGGPGGELDAGLVQMAVHGVMIQDGADLSSSFQVLAAIGDPQLRQTALAALARGAMAASVLETAAQVPAGAARDCFIAAAAGDDRYAPEDREKLAAEIGDADLAERVRKRIEKNE